MAKVDFDSLPDAQPVNFDNLPEAPESDGWLERHGKAFTSDLLSMIFGLEQSARAGAANWLNPAQQNISYMPDESLVEMYEGTGREQEVRDMLSRERAAREQASEKIRETMDDRTEKLAEYDIGKRSKTEKLAGMIGSAVGLVPIGAAAGLTRNPALAIGVPAAAEAMAETGGTQRALVNEHGMDPLDAAQDTRLQGAANFAAIASMPGATGLFGRAAGGNVLGQMAPSLGRRLASTSGQEGAQEGIQYMLGSLTESDAADEPFSEVFDLGELVESVVGGATVGALFEGGGTAIGSGYRRVAGQRPTPESRAEAQREILNMQQGRAQDVALEYEANARRQRHREMREEAEKLRHEGVKRDLARREARRRLEEAQRERDTLGASVRGAKNNRERMEAERRAAEAQAELDRIAEQEAAAQREAAELRERAQRLEAERRRQPRRQGELPPTRRGSERLRAEEESVGMPAEDVQVGPGQTEGRPAAPESRDTAKLDRRLDRREERDAARREKAEQKEQKEQRREAKKDLRRAGSEARRTQRRAEDAGEAGAPAPGELGRGRDSMKDAREPIEEIARRQRQQEDDGPSDYFLGSGLGGLQGALEGDQPSVPEYSPEAGNPVSQAAYEYHQTGDIVDWTVESSVDELVPPDFIEEAEQRAAEEGDMQANQSWLSSAKDMLPQGGGGRFGNFLSRHILQPQRQVTMARDDYVSRLMTQGKKMIDGLTKNERRDLAERMQKKEHRGDLDVQAMRAFMDMIRNEVNAARRARGQEEVEYRGDYVPHMQSLSWLDRLLARGKNALAEEGVRPPSGEGAATGGVSAPGNSYFNPFAEARTLDISNPEMDIGVLLDAYIRYSAKDIFHTPVIRQNEAFANELERAGLPGVAKSVRDYNDWVWRESTPPVDAKFAEGRGTAVYANLTKFQQKALHDAVFLGNLSWTMGMQPASVANVIMKHGWVPSARAVFAAFNPAFRRRLFEDTVGGREKAAGYNVTRQDLADAQSVGHMSSTLPRTRREYVRAVLGIFAKQMEKNLYAFNAAAAFYDSKGQRLLREGRMNELLEYMESSAGQGQQDYYRAGQPGIMQQSIFKAHVPFMSWYVQTASQIGEVLYAPAKHALTGKAGGTGHYNEFIGKSRMRSSLLAAKRLSDFLIAMWLLEELWGYPLFGRKPFSDLIFGGGGPTIMGVGKNATELVKAVAESVKYESGEPLKDYALRFWVPAGSQSKRLLDTFDAIAKDGDVTTLEERDGEVRERTLFNIYDDVDDDSRALSGLQKRVTGPYGIARDLQSAVAGPYATPAGRERSDIFHRPPGYLLWTEALDKIAGPGEEPKSGVGRRRPRPPKPPGRPSMPKPPGR